MKCYKFGARRGYLRLAVALLEFRGKGLALVLARKAIDFLLGKGWLC